MKTQKTKRSWCVKAVTLALILVVICPYLLHLGYQNSILEPNLPVMSLSQEDSGVYSKILGGILDFYQFGF